MDVNRNGYDDGMSDFEKTMIPNISDVFLNPLVVGG